MSDFSKRLKAERKRLGLNQADLGAAGGVTKGAQLNYESGERSPTADYLQAISRVGVDVSYVLTGRRSAAADLSPEQDLLLSSFSSADERGRTALLSVALIASKATHNESQNIVRISGDVGQSIAGNAEFSAPVSFSINEKNPS